MQKKIKKKIKELAAKQSISNNYLYLAEEVGELAKDIVEGKMAHAPLEAVDVIVAALGVFYALGGTEEMLEERFERSVTKWESNYNK